MEERCLVKIVQQKHNFFICSNDKQYLNRTLDSFITYTSKVSPGSFLGEKIVRNTTEKLKKETNCEYFICINDYLPSWLNDYLKVSKHIPWDASGFSFGKFASGLAPVVADSYRTGKECFTRVDEDALVMPGDYIEIVRYLPSAEKFVAVHGFTYINQEICLSVNGFNHPPQLCLLNDVLALYEGSQDIHLFAYRKREDFNYPNNIKKLFMNILDINSHKIMSLFICKDKLKQAQTLIELCDFMLTNHPCAEIIMKNFDSLMKSALSPDMYQWVMTNKAELLENKTLKNDCI